jgi:folate-binding protein YgfZ
LSTKEISPLDGVTISETFRGWLIVAPNSVDITTTMSRSEYDDYRVENMIPMQGYEITPKNHPLACGLGHLVHESKGCYIGQEVLARMRSRGKQGKELVRLPNPVENATTIGKKNSLVIRRV